MINIEGIDKEEVLCALYNASKVQGMGIFLSAGIPMQVAEAKMLLEHNKSFDYLHGKVMKIDLSDDKQFEEWLYDRDNGIGAAQKVIDNLRAANTEHIAD